MLTAAPLVQFSFYQHFLQIAVSFALDLDFLLLLLGVSIDGLVGLLSDLGVGLFQLCAIDDDFLLVYLDGLVGTLRTGLEAQKLLRLLRCAHVSSRGPLQLRVEGVHGLVLEDRGLQEHTILVEGVSEDLGRGRLLYFLNH